MPEWLDQLPSDDPRMWRSRKDLQRINWWMSNAKILTEILVEAGAGWAFDRLVELGAGDGTFGLRVARRLVRRIGPMKIVLVDQANLVSEETQAGFQQLGWEPEIVTADVFEWLSGFHAGAEGATGYVANLFLHQFYPEQLQQLFQRVALQGVFLAACDPRRSRAALVGSRMLGLIGCNEITRHDAVVSVRAGFEGGELSALWPRKEGWQVLERKAGMFSHLFVAAKCGS